MSVPETIVSRMSDFSSSLYVCICTFWCRSMSVYEVLSLLSLVSDPSSVSWLSFEWVTSLKMSDTTVPFRKDTDTLIQLWTTYFTSLGVLLLVKGVSFKVSAYRTPSLLKSRNLFDFGVTCFWRVLTAHYVLPSRPLHPSCGLGLVCPELWYHFSNLK